MEEGDGHDDPGPEEHQAHSRHEERSRTILAGQPCRRRRLRIVEHLQLASGRRLAPPYLFTLVSFQ